MTSRSQRASFLQEYSPWEATSAPADGSVPIDILPALNGLSEFKNNTVNWERITVRNMEGIGGREWR